ncbi:MAG: polymer-forming cytoskeletal family protein [Spirochaetales bacterium]|nr:MAG: polymer-forming cytoskeletal family protein [Spirochaetales bacterium]
MGKSTHTADPRDIPRVRTRLGADTTLKGTLRFTESVEIAGKLEGKIIAEGFLYIKEGAEIKADIRAQDIIVGGTVFGNIDAINRLEVLETGKIYGNVRTAKFRVADGVIFEGKCEMVKDGDKVDVFSAPIDQVKESVQRA